MPLKDRVAAMEPPFQIHCFLVLHNNSFLHPCIFHVMTPVKATLNNAAALKNSWFAFYSVGYSSYPYDEDTFHINLPYHFHLIYRFLFFEIYGLMILFYIQE